MWKTTAKDASRCNILYIGNGRLGKDRLQMRTDWIPILLLALLWLAAGGLPWKALQKRRNTPKDEG
jgi:hypothetical protein